MKIKYVLLLLIILSGRTLSTQKSEKVNRAVANSSGITIHVHPPKAGETGLSVLQRAKEDVRSQLIAGEKNIHVIVHEGDYYLEKSLFLEKEDGTRTGEVVWKAARGERVRLLGAMPIVLSDSNKNSEIKQANLPSQGIHTFGKIVGRGFGLPEVIANSEIFQNGRPLQLSRHPNKGWLRIVTEGGEGKDFSVKESVHFDSSQSEGWFHGYWGNDWADQLIQLKEMKKNLFSLTEAPRYPMKSSQRVVLLNTVEYLDESGEYLIDSEGTVFLIPFEGKPNEDQEFLISLTEGPLIQIENASNITFQGFEIGFTRGKAILIKGGDHIEINSNLIQNTGLEGLYLHGGKSHAARGNRLINTGTEGIIVEGGERRSLTSSDHVVENNELYHFGRLGKTYHPGIEVRGVGARVAHNEVAYGPHFAIRFHGNEHLIEYNHIHDVVRETSDAGAVYIGRDWSMRGNIIQFNYIHNNGSSIGGPGAMGVYLDDLASGTTIHGNYFYKSGRCAFVGGGRDNIVTNNAFIDCANAYHLDNRGVSWSNVDFFYGKNMEFVPKMEAMDYLNPPFSIQYPRLFTILQEDPLLPLGNIFSNNLQINSPDKSYGNPVAMEGNVKDNEHKEQASFSKPLDFEKFLKANVKKFPEGFDASIGEKIGVQDSIHRKLLLDQFELESTSLK